MLELQYLFYIHILPQPNLITVRAVLCHPAAVIEVVGYFYDGVVQLGVLQYGPVDKSAIGYSMELRPMALRVLWRLTPGSFRVVRSFTIRFRFNAVAERRQCS